MPSHILIPVALDHEGVAAQKIAVARKLMDEGGKITLLTVLENVPGFVAEFVTVKEENHVTSRVRAGLEKAAGGAPDIEIAIDKGKPGVVVTEYARRNDVDLIIVGSHAPGVEDYFLGSTAARIARRAHCSVHILR